MIVVGRRWIWLVSGAIALALVIGVNLVGGGIYSLLPVVPPHDGCEGVMEWGFWMSSGETVVTTDPPAGELIIVIDVSTRTLTLMADGQPFKKWPCAVGKPSTPSPIGEWKVISKSYNWGGGFGSRWHGLNVPWGIYGIHGTNKPGSIGTAASGGCIRMFNRHVEELFQYTKVGTPVVITGRKIHPSFSRILKQGNTGRDVVALQLRLRAAGFDPGWADGRYGPATVQSIKKLQDFYGLPATGEADNNVYYLLNLK